jgi:molybdenum cofactor guanylyltransferase
MGASKAGLRFGDDYVLQHIIDVATQVASPLVLASRSGIAIPPIIPALPLVLDNSDHAGPLAGIAAGMSALRDCCDAVIVVPCDHPFVSAAVLDRMVERLGEHRAVVPELEGTLFPTLAVYRLNTYAILEEMLRNGEFRAQEFARQCNPGVLRQKDLADIDPEQKSFWNINTPAEYDMALAAVYPDSKGLPCAH